MAHYKEKLMLRDLTGSELIYVAGGAAVSDDTIIVNEDGVCINYGSTSTCYFPSAENYSSSGEVYYSDTGLAFDDFGSCVEYYADQFHDQEVAQLGSLVPGYDIVDSAIPHGPSTDNYQDAVNICQ
jgi:hypothetical protein